MLSIGEILLVIFIGILIVVTPRVASIIWALITRDDSKRSKRGLKDLSSQEYKESGKTLMIDARLKYWIVGNVVKRKEKGRDNKKEKIEDIEYLPPGISLGAPSLIRPNVPTSHIETRTMQHPKEYRGKKLLIIHPLPVEVMKKLLSKKEAKYMTLQEKITQAYELIESLTDENRILKEKPRAIDDLLEKAEILGGIQPTPEAPNQKTPLVIKPEEKE